MFSIRKWLASKMFTPLITSSNVGASQTSEPDIIENGYQFLRSLSRNMTSTTHHRYDQGGPIIDYADMNQEPAGYFACIYDIYDIGKKKKQTDEKRLKALMYSFCHSNRELNMISAELDTFDGRKDTDRCSVLVNSLKLAQDKVITLIFKIMDELGCKRSSRDYRLKFADELLVGEGTESLNSQIWFGAECLAAGSTITNNPTESNYLRPIANTLTTTLENIRFELRNCADDLPSRFVVFCSKAFITLFHLVSKFQWNLSKD